MRTLIVTVAIVVAVVGFAMFPSGRSESPAGDAPSEAAAAPQTETEVELDERRSAGPTGTDGETASAAGSSLRRIAPVLAVERIEPVLPFWHGLGFETTTEVPEDDHLGFAILARDGQEVMYQTIESLSADLGADVPPGSGALLFVEVEDLDAVIEALGDADVVVPRRRTFYGADEIWVRDPAGHLVGFAEFGEPEGPVE